jgi:hypothetical protein
MNELSFPEVIAKEEIYRGKVFDVTLETIREGDAHVSSAKSSITTGVRLLFLFLMTTQSHSSNNIVILRESICTKWSRERSTETKTRLQAQHANSKKNSVTSQRV